MNTTVNVDIHKIKIILILVAIFLFIRLCVFVYRLIFPKYSVYDIGRISVNFKNPFNHPWLNEKTLLFLLEQGFKKQGNYYEITNHTNSNLKKVFSKCIPIGRRPKNDWELFIVVSNTGIGIEIEDSCDSTIEHQKFYPFEAFKGFTECFNYVLVVIQDIRKDSQVFLKA